MKNICFTIPQPFVMVSIIRSATIVERTYELNIIITNHKNQEDRNEEEKKPLRDINEIKAGLGGNDNRL